MHSFTDPEGTIELLKEEAIFSSSPVLRRRCIMEICKKAQDPVSAISDVIDSLPTGDDLRIFCLGVIDRLKEEGKSGTRLHDI